MDERQFSQRVRACEQKLYNTARMLLPCQADCEDAVQEALFKAWARLDSLRDTGRFEAWLMRILIRECVNMQRRQRRVTPVASLPEQGESDADTVALRDALDALPQKLRTVTVLYYMEGYGVRELARMLRVPKGTVTSRLHMARGRLRELLKEEIE